tara:strand:- start:185 stop:379 length:195 start_codon:yes stop_codon:yes gene_type:complete
MNDIAQICKLNNMTEDEFLNQISLNFLALMDMQLDKNENGPLTITRGNVSLLIFRPERITHGSN